MSNPDSELNRTANIEDGKPSGYPMEFFDLQVKFAQKLSQVSKKPIGDTLLHDTSFYRRFGFGRSLDPQNPDWMHFILWREGDDLTQRAYQFYLREKDKVDQQIAKEYVQFGCFSYDYNFFTRTILVHFTAPENNNQSPLSDEEVAMRKQELTQMFTYIKNHHSNAKLVIGDSWLYNLEKYKRLFPNEYTKTPKRIDRPDSLAVWGQFLDRDERRRPSAVQDFNTKLAGANTEQEVLDSFPLKQLEVRADIDTFYNFYGIE